MRNTVLSELCRLAETDKRICLLTADLGYGVVDQFRERFPNRFFDVGISEQAMTSMAAGLALEGMIPFTYSIANFPTLRCLEQIRNDICANALPVKIIAVGSGFSYGQLGMSHHATEDLAALRAMPGLRIFSPADKWEAAAAVRASLDFPGPCYLRLAKGGEPDLHSESIKEIEALQPLLGGRELVILAAGAVTSEAVSAAKLLADAGHSAGVWSVPTLSPLDRRSIEALVSAARLCVTVEEHNVTGGLGSAVAEVLAEMDRPHAPLLRLGLHGFTPGVGSREWLRRQCGIDGAGIAAAILARLDHPKEELQ